MLELTSTPPLDRTVRVFGSVSKTQEEILKDLSSDRPDWPRQLKGSWALAVVETTGKHQKTTLVTDRWGTRPLYYTIQNRRLLFAEDLDELFLSIKTTANNGALTRFLMEDLSHPEETVVNEIKKVSPGTILVFYNDELTKSVWTEKQTWPLEHQDFKTTVALWEKELRHHLVSLLPLHQKWGIFVSGGLDSTGLVALCMDIVRKNNWTIEIELYNLSTDHSESYDQGFCQKLADHYQIPLFTHQTSPMEIQELYKKWKTQKTTLPFFPTLQMFAPLMKQAKQNGCGGLFFGYGADEQWTVPLPTIGLDFLTQQKWSDFLKTLIRSENAFLDTFRVLKLWAQYKSPHRLKDLIRSVYSFGIHPHLYPRAELKEQKKELQKRMQAGTSYLYSYSQKQVFLRNFTSGNNTYNLSCHLTMARQFGLNVHFPYLSPEMLDISLQTTSELFLNVQDKQVLRELLKDLLLEEVRTAPKFQDYSELAFKTSLLLAQEDQDYLVKHHWIKPHRSPLFDDDFFFEVLFVEKFLKASGATAHDKTSF